MMLASKMEEEEALGHTKLQKQLSKLGDAQS